MGTYGRSSRQPWDDDENGQNPYCDGPGCLCEDFGRREGHCRNWINRSPAHDLIAWAKERGL